jgi:hypothetical protein
MAQATAPILDSTASMDANSDQLKAAPEFKYPSNT